MSPRRRLAVADMLVLHVGGVPVQHRPVVPPHQSHQVAFRPAARQPVIRDRVPEHMGVDRLRVVARLLGPPVEHLVDARARHRPAVAAA